MLTVSIIMGVYNAEPFLRESLQSVLQQTFRDFELILVNDGSTDRSGEIMHAVRDPRVRVIDLEKNQGLSNALNLAFEHSRGQFIARHDADDLSLPNRLAAQVDFLARNPDVGVLSGSANVIQEATQVETLLQFPGSHHRLLWLMSFLNPIIHPAVMMRREVFQNAGGYRDLPAAQDYDLWCRLWDKTHFASIKETLVQLHKHDDNISTAKNELQTKVSLEIRQRFISQMLNTTVHLSDVRALANYLSKTGRVSTREAIKGHALVAKLCRYTLRKGDISFDDRAWICQNAMTKLDYFWLWRKRKNLRFARRLLDQFSIRMQCSNTGMKDIGSED